MTDCTYLRYSSVPLEYWKDKLNQQSTYFLAESAINPKVRELADEAIKNVGSAEDDNRLYWGEMGKVHASVSPYLMKLDDWQNFEDSIAYQENWGVIIQLNDEVAKTHCSHFYLLNHLREWTLVTPPQQEPLLLRLADWEVLNVLLNASNYTEQKTLFGPVEAFAYWHKDKQEVDMVTLQHFDVETLPHRSPQLLSDKQSQALNAYASRHQYKKYMEHLKSHHDEVQSWKGDEMTAFLARNIEQAGQLKFTVEKDVVRYLSLAVIFGELFTEMPWAQNALSQISIVGTQSKMDRLYQRAIEELDKEPGK